MSVDTKRTTGRRKVEFNSLSEILDDVRSLAGRPTRPLGNWSLGRICSHLAASFDTAVDGPTFRPAWYLRLLGPLLKNRFLSRPMQPGFQLPPHAGRLLPGDTETQQGISLLERAIERYRKAEVLKPNAVFGPMTRAEWDRLHLLHSAMHLSFIVPEQP